MYAYETEKPKIFTERGQFAFIAIRDWAHKTLRDAGAFRMQEAMAVASGDSWLMLACVDRLVELREIRELTKQGDVPGQHRVFVKA